MSNHPQHPNDIPRKRKRISHDSEDLAWTAARCNRLLRSITQRIATLRKLVDNDFTGSAPKPRKSLEKRVAGHWSTQDPVWMGDAKAKRKAGARTFAGRKKVVKQETSRDVANSSAIAFPSPFVRRLGSGGSHLEIASPQVQFIRPPMPAKVTRQLPIKSETPRIEAEKGLCSAFDNFLHAVNEKAPTRGRGARSLMSICLKNVPSYIAINEEDEDEEDSTFASETLDYLEDLGTKENGGWSGLREVVGSQVMFAICDSVDDGVLSGEVVRALIERCEIYGSIREAQDILATWVEAADPLTAKHIEVLNNFGRWQRCENFKFRLMRDVVEENPARLAAFCKAPRFWNDLLRSLTGASSFEAAEFLSSCVRLCFEENTSCSKAVKEVILRLTTMAASAILLNDSKMEINRVSNIVHQLTANTIFSDHFTGNRELHHLLVNSSILLLGISQGTPSPFSPISLADRLPPSLKSRLLRSDFITELLSTTLALGQHLDSDILCLLLERIVEHAPIAPLYRELALAIITTKQQSSQSSEDEVLYAEYVNIISSAKTASDPAKTPRTPFRKTQKAQFRWEEGICEWVAKTPFTVAPPAVSSSTQPTSLSSDEKENVLPTPAKSCTSAQQDTRLVQLNSPDVLALSPRKAKVAESPLAPRQVKRARKEKVVVRVLPKKDGRRKKSRLSIRSRAGEDSADELGF